MDNNTIIALAAVIAAVLATISLIFNIIHSRSEAHSSERAITNWEKSVEEWKKTTKGWETTIEQLKQIVNSHNSLVQAFETDIQAIKGEMSILREQVHDVEAKVGRNQELAIVAERSAELDRELKNQELAQKQREHDFKVLGGLAKAVLWLSDQPDYDEDEEY
jgi:peptidoglycan hydrolase CwlO-like protein